MTLMTQCVSNVAVGHVNSKTLNLTRTIQVPFLTNERCVDGGEELFLKVEEKKTTDDKPKSRRWTEAHQEQARKQKLDAKKQKQEKANAAIGK